MSFGRRGLTLLKQTLLQTAPQSLIARQVNAHDLAGDGISRGPVIGVTDEITVLDHQHPGLTIIDQAKPEGLPQRVSRTQQRAIALTAGGRSRNVSGQLENVFEGLDQALLFALIECWRLKITLQLLQRPAVVAEALLPANILCHPANLDGCQGN